MATIVFDVNETLLDLSALDPVFATIAGDRGGEVTRLWFTRLLHSSLVVSTLGQWHDFATLARAALVDTLERCGIPAQKDGVAEVVGTMRRLSAHEDVRPSIQRLRAAGHRTMALTNSAQQMAEAQLAYAGLDDLLDPIMSVEPTRRYKPHPAVYEHVQGAVDAEPRHLVMIAAHDWDCAGALQVGWRAGFVARGGIGYSPVLPPPTWQAPEMGALVEEVLAAG